MANEMSPSSDDANDSAALQPTIVQPSDGPGAIIDSVEATGETRISVDSSAESPPPNASERRDEDPAPRRFGDYEIAHELARGGMGVVFRARQVSLNRPVAVKMILASQLASADDVQRFYVEAEAAAKLDHPGIVPIYEVGEHDGQHFFSMGLVEGGSLANLVKDGPAAPRRAAELLRSIAIAVQYAHARNIVHRDLKPANILLDIDGQPKVTDFGLAKNVEGESNLTTTGQIMGTPSYMPPEQAAGRMQEVGSLADVYSLGAILYFLLIGRPPFEGANVVETLKKVLDEEPVSPRRRNAAVDLDLETICLKCLQKDPARRYSSPAELADELQRYLEGEPIAARPVGTFERAAKWSRRHPLPTALFSVIGFALIVLIVGGAWYQSRLASSLVETEEERDKVKQAKAATTKLLYESLENEAAFLTTMRPDGYDARAWKLLDQARKLDTPAVNRARLRRLAVSSLGHVSAKPPVRFDNLGAHVLAADVTPDERFVFAGLKDGHLVVLDLADRRVVHRFDDPREEIVRISIVNSNRVITQSRLCREVLIWQRGEDDAWTLGARLQPNPRNPTTGDDGFYDLALTPDGNHVVGLAPLNEKNVTAFKTTIPGGLVHGLKFGPAAKSGHPSFAVRPLNPGKHENDKFKVFKGITTASQHYAIAGGYLAVGFDGAAGNLPFGLNRNSKFATGGKQQDMIALCNLRNGRVERILRTECGQLGKVAISRDGEYIACSGSRSVQVFRRETGERISTISEFGSCEVQSFIGDGGDLLLHTAGECIWYSLSRRQPIARFPQDDRYDQMFSSTAGRHLFQRAKHGLWVSSVAPSERRDVAGHWQFAHCVRFSPDGRLLATSGRDEQIRLWNVDTLELLSQLPGGRFDFSPDGNLLAVVGADGLRLWHVPEGAPASPLTPIKHYAATMKLKFNPQGNLLAIAGITANRGIRVWRAQRNTPAGKGISVTLNPVFADTNGFHDFAWSPSGRLLAYRSGDATRVHDFDRPRQEISVEVPSSVNGAQFVSDDRLLLVAARETVGNTGSHSVELWDLKARRKLKAVRLKSGVPTALSPDRRLVLCRDHVLRTDTLATSYKLPFWNNFGIDADWSPDGRRIVLGFDNGNVVV